jgi:hypothetical protein
MLFAALMQPEQSLNVIFTLTFLSFPYRIYSSIFLQC